MKTIYDLKLHEELYTATAVIMRVPGGWIYNYGSKSSFVPYNDEFNPKAKPQPEDYTEDPPEDTLPKYKVGDVVRITNTEGGHGFDVGDKVEITSTYGDGSKFYDAKGKNEEWCVGEDQLEDTLQ